MDLFLNTALSFPTVVFSVLLLIAVSYWLIALFGLVDHDLFGGDLTGGHHVDGGEVGALAGLLMKLGLDGVPITLIFTVAAWIGWILCYLAELLWLQFLPVAALHYVYGAGVLVGATLLAIPLTGLLLHPTKRLFVKAQSTTSVSLLGRTAVVRSPEVSWQQGTASVEDGGAGLILMVRAEPGLFRRGDRVVLVEYLEAQNAYKVIADRPPTN